MADYIRSNILCQAYIHIEKPKVQASQFPELNDSLTSFAERRSQFMLYPQVSANVRFRSGSLVAYLTVLGSVYVALQGYPKFREGVTTLFGDVKRLADSMILETQFVSRARSVDISRAEARTGVIGSLKLLIDNIDNVGTSAGIVRVETLAVRLQHYLDDAIKLLDTLVEPRDIKFVAVNVKDIIFELPLSPSDPKNTRPSKKASTAYREAIRKFTQTMDDYAEKANTPQ